MNTSSVQKEEQKLSQAVLDLQKEEQQAKSNIEIALRNKEKTIAQARTDASNLVEKAKEKGQEQKNSLLAKAEETTLIECKKIIEKAHSDARALKDRLSGKIPVAASKISASVLDN